MLERERGESRVGYRRGAGRGLREEERRGRGGSGERDASGLDERGERREWEDG